MECDFEPQLKQWPSFSDSCLCLNSQLAPFLQPVPLLKNLHGCWRFPPRDELAFDLLLLELRPDFTLLASLSLSSET